MTNFLREIQWKTKPVGMHGYPFHLPVFQQFESLQLDKSVTFFVGENGSGKSTFLEAIAALAGFQTGGGSRHSMLQIDRGEAPLAEYLRLSWMPKITRGFFLRSETFYQFASYLDGEGPEMLQGYGGESLHNMSHGESFLTIFQHRLNEDGIYFLDEPEAALSPTRQLALLKMMNDLVKTGGAQFVIVTHSPILLGFPDAQIFSFDGDCIEEIAYEDTEHYEVTRSFLTNRDRMLQHLFADDDFA